MNTTLVWSTFSRAMHRYLLHRVKNRHDADDLLQEIFVKIHLKLPTLTQRESLPAWVWQLTRNTLLDYHKKRRLPIAELDQADFLATEHPPETFNQHLAECVQTFLELLPPDRREALQLADLQNVPQKMLAAQWGLSHSGAKSRVQRARGELHGLFNQCCRIEADKYGNVTSVECLEKVC
jgi:RNA polymerase sigma-70 factor (ECF subfamily)